MDSIDLQGWTLAPRGLRRGAWVRLAKPLTVNGTDEVLVAAGTRGIVERRRGNFVFVHFEEFAGDKDVASRPITIVMAYNLNSGLI